MTPGELAIELRMVQERILPALEEVVVAVVFSATQKARRYIGHEMPEWAALKETTIYEKTRLGYVGQVSATDPLLRTHEMGESIEGAAEGLSGVIGSDDPKMKWQEFGATGVGRNRTGTIPPRPSIGMAMMEAAEESELLMLAAIERMHEV